VPDLVAAEYTVPTTVRYASELLVVLVDESARMAGDISDGGGCHPVGIKQTVEAPADQDAVNGRARSAEQWTEPIGSIACARSDGQDLGFRSLREPARRTLRPRRSVEQTCPALGPVPAHPLVAGGSADTELLGNMGDGPALAQNSGDKKLAAEDR
jgi:hypothetical protein